MSIAVRGVSKRFNKVTVLDDVDVDVAAGELVALLGPSGSGKTTLLRVIAGLEIADSGSILLDGEDATSRPVKERGVGFVFQHYALFRHMSVFENVAFGLRVKPRRKRPSEEDIESKVRDLLELVQLDTFAARYPSQLSGGQRQRVALARALAVGPRVLLLDEPFGALDAKVRQDLRRSLRDLHDDLGVTTVFVTHDQEEALELADRVVVMNRGVVEQVGSPQEVYDRPATPFVCSFLGDVNVLQARIEQDTAHIGDVALGIPSTNGATGDGVVYVRPHALDIRTTPNGGHQFAARVVHVNSVGPIVKIDLLAEWGKSIRAELTQERFGQLSIQRNSEVFVCTDPASGVFAHVAADSAAPPSASLADERQPNDGHLPETEVLRASKPSCINKLGEESGPRSVAV
jgi:sulfate transport system ATP-binding protein